MAKIQDIVELEIAKEFNENFDPIDYLKRSGMVKKPEKMLKDGWGNPFEIDIDSAGNVTITSQALIDYKAKHGIKDEEDEE